MCGRRGHGEMVSQKPSKLLVRVRFPLPAPIPLSIPDIADRCRYAAWLGLPGNRCVGDFQASEPQPPHGSATTPSDCHQPAFSPGSVPQWWRGLDSNQRRLSQRIYSPSPLTTRAPLHCCSESCDEVLNEPCPVGHRSRSALWRQARYVSTVDPRLRQNDSIRP